VRLAGPGIAVGDLVQLKVRSRKAKVGRPFEDEEGEGWLWMGFQRYGYYEFHVETDGIANALLGRKGGSVLTIARDSYGQYDEGQLGRVTQMPFGRDSDFANPLRKTPSSEKRAQGHTYEGKVYPANLHYSDRTVAIFVPKGFRASDATNLVFSPMEAFVSPFWADLANWLIVTGALACASALTNAGLSSPDPARRRPIYFQIQTLLADEVPWIFLRWLPYRLVAPSYISGIQPNGFNHLFWNVAVWRVQ